MTEYETNLVTLVHYLSFGSKTEIGLSLKEALRYLNKPIASKNNRTALECLRTEGLAFVNELKAYMNELDSY